MLNRQLHKKYFFSLLVIVLYGLFLFFVIIYDSLYLRIAAAALPFLLITIYLALYHPLWYAMLMALILPLSVNLEDIGMGVGVSLPGEIMVVFMALVVLINLLNGRYITKTIIRHPVSIAIALNLLWMVIASVTSTMPVISWKYMMMRIAFVVVFYLFFMQVLGSLKNIQKFMWLFAAALTMVIVYTLLRHSQFNFIQQVNGYVPQPFFKDHTIYGASVALLLPFFAGWFFIPSKDRIFPRFFSMIVLPFILAAIVFSYSRAVWLSVALIIIGTIFILLRVKLRYIFAGLFVLLAVGLYFKDPIIYRLQNVESERGSSVKEHATSIANVNTSASNLERINRWEAGLDMFSEKPLLGFGPGTYPFQYAPYQDEELMTRISTYFGDKGGVHSEYLKPLTETGLPGFLTFAAVILLTVGRGMRLVYKNKNTSVRIVAASLLLGLTTYYVHGFFNFFLHTDKIAALFWGMTGFIVALDIKYGKAANKSSGINV
ncbi:MAG: O-antigen ligase family protein [Bacteroidales bacterium]|nr:O-antigen ligase family protein [Bacteroidales bacterium]MCF8338812.1 O-antigen ligase family protein [Bacteroidales bacterium]